MERLWAQERDSLIVHNNQRLFLSGMNLAWINFANDLAAFDENQFTRQIDGLAAAGGNTLRWWLHTNGRNSPIFTDGVVSGINPIEIANLERALDIAYERGVLLMLCLWSFDMLQPNALESNWPRNRALVEDPVKTQAYIDNALIPLVEGVKGHPGIICWEIFNEPEGMIEGYGWTPEKVQFKYVQQFINMTAGAIKRIDPNVKVSNGSWNILASTDIGNFHNYYRDDRLIAAGGDPLGVLDFYMIHYYPQHFPTSQSPFHRHVSHWQLDKPVVIGEFPSLGISKGTLSLTTEQAYNYAIENGYAGALSWTMTGHDGNGGLPESRQAMLNLQAAYPDIINIIPVEGFNFPPYLKAQLTPIMARMASADTVYTAAYLNDIFGSYTEGMPLTFRLLNSTNEALCIPYVENNYLKILVKANQSGSARVTVQATDTLRKSRIASMSVSIYDPGSSDFLRNRRAYASTIENAAYSEGYAVDGGPESRWSSEYSDDQWIAVEMEQVRTIRRVVLRWEAAFGQAYIIQVSLDGKSWTDVYTEPQGDGGWDRIVFEPVEAKFIRMRGVTRGTQWGYSLFTFEAYADRGLNTAPVFAEELDTLRATVNENFSYVIPLNIVTDPDEGERLSYSVSLAGSEGLPAWLKFDWITRTLSGLPLQDVAGQTYTLALRVTDMLGESDETTFTLTVDNKLEVENTGTSSMGLNIYPNPARHQLIIRSSNQITNADLYVYTATGQRVITRRIASTMGNGLEYALDVASLSPGVYFLKLSTIGSSGKLRFVKE